MIKVYLQNVYYAFVCDHSNIVKTSEQGLNLLSDLKVKEYERSMSAKFTYNLALTHFLQHNFSAAIDSFLKVAENYYQKQIYTLNKLFKSDENNLKAFI